MKLTEVIRRPLVTEKTTTLRDDGKTVVFEVAKDANKIEIRRAVEALFKVEVSDVHTHIARGKKKRVGKSVGQRPARKKAIVTLKAGQTIEFFEGV